MQIIGILLLKNEEFYLDRIIANIHAFCDKIVIADNGSEDDTMMIARHWERSSEKVEVFEVAHPGDAHDLVRGYAGTHSWVFAVDGDEIYDPAGLAQLRVALQSGRYDRWWTIFGNVLNCDQLDLNEKRAFGYLAPPCRSMTKLFNFAAIDDWYGVCERLLGGTIVFRPGWTAELRLNLHETVSWEESMYRCLHVCFLPRSRSEQGQNEHSRLNPEELRIRREASGCLAWLRRLILGKDVSWTKQDKYHRGPRVNKEISAFLPPHLTSLEPYIVEECDGRPSHP